MKNRSYTLYLLLTGALTLALLGMLLLRTLVPRFILPQGDLPNLALVSLAALVLERYLAPGGSRCLACGAVFSGLAFGLLPLAAGMAAPGEALALGLKGGVLFTGLTWAFDSAMDRLSSGPAAKAAPALCALGLYLAVQCAMGMFM